MATSVNADLRPGRTDRSPSAGVPAAIEGAALILWNLRVITRPAARLWDVEEPLISILVPARNEEEMMDLHPGRRCRCSTRG